MSVLESVKYNSIKCGLKYTSYKLRNNYNIVKQTSLMSVLVQSVKNNGMECSLKYASNNLKNNYDIVLEALKHYCVIIPFKYAF